LGNKEQTMNSDEDMLSDNLIASCYCLSNVDDKQDTVDAIAVKMIEEGVSDLDIGMLAIFVEKLLTFYASDEAVPLLEKNFPEKSIALPSGMSRYEDDLPFDMDRLNELNNNDDCPFDSSEPSDKDLEEIEQNSFLENLWEDAEFRDKELADFSMGGFSDEPEPEPDLSRMTRRERKKWKKAQRAARKKREAEAVRNRDFGFDKFETNHKKQTVFHEKKPSIHYEFDVLTVEDSDVSDEIGNITQVSKFEPNSEKKSFVFGTPTKKASFNPESFITGLPRLPQKIIGDNWESPYKRRWDWDTTGCP